MADVCWTSFILLLGVIHCYENLSRGQTTTLSQSSRHEGQYASYANDGELRTTFIYCAHTSSGHSKAWFQVDLGKVFSIKSVKIYHRKESTGWKQYRFRHFYLDVSNSSAAVTNTTQRIRCYTDNSTGSNLPPNIIDLPCKHAARYIIVETTYDAPEDDPITGAILEICEIEVYGCEIGKYGDGCQDCSGCETCDVITGDCMSVPCSVNCVSGLCDLTTGYCTQGCTNGYWGNTCTSTCPPNCHGGGCDRISGNCNGCYNNVYWGQACNSRCPQVCNGGFCDQSNSYCSSGCTHGRYGNQCEHICNINCLRNTCVQISGVCTNGCADSYYGDKCEYQCSPHCSPGRCERYNGTCTGCSDGYFGSTCQNTCSVNCAEGTCDQQTGRCDRGCKANWDGDQCDRCKRGFYGGSCSNACPSCPSGCDRISGDCVGTCPNNKYGSKCEFQCSLSCTGGCNKVTGACDGGCVVGRFGADCRKNCSTGCVADCNQYDGRCKCKTGWRGDKCDECTPDFYGELCDERCISNCVNGTCFLNNGTRVGGCTGRFIDDKCTQDYQQFCTKTCDNTVAIVSIVLSVIIVLTGSVINFLCWRRNQTLNTKKGIKENVDSQTRAHDLTEIPSSDNPYENPVRSDYAELGELDKPNAYDELHKYTEAAKNI